MTPVTLQEYARFNYVASRVVRAWNDTEALAKGSGISSARVHAIARGTQVTRDEAARLYWFFSDPSVVRKMRSSGALLDTGRLVPPDEMGMSNG